MNRVAFLFTQTPYGNSAGREGLDAALATSNFNEDIALFFIGDGVFQLLAGQKPQSILMRDHVAAFAVLSLYDIRQIYLCSASLQERGIPLEGPWVIPPELLPPATLRRTLERFDTLITF